MDFIQQAYKGKNNWWRYLITLTIVMFPFVLNFIIYFFIPETFKKIYDDLENFKGNKNILLAQNLLSFVFLLGFLFFLIKYLHKRAIVSLITSRKKIDWKRFLFGFLFWAFLTLLLLTLSYFTSPEEHIWNFKPIPFLFLVIISIILIPLQTSFEELLFRGYLMQGIGILAKNRWFPLLVTSVLFGLMHSLNPEINKIGVTIISYYIGTGLLFGIITLLDEGTELVLGLHAANNIVAALFITSDWMVFQTDALFIDTSEPNINLIMYVPLFIVYPLVLIVLHKKYGWKNWKQKLFGNIKIQD